MGIQWYPADHDALPLPYPSAILNSAWEENDLERDYNTQGNVGEVGDAPRTFNGRDVPQHATGGHVCGRPEWFADGVPFDLDRPPTVYNPDGLPVCCAPGRGIAWGAAPELPAGGIAWGAADGYAQGGLYWSGDDSNIHGGNVYHLDTVPGPTGNMYRIAPGTDDEWAAVGSNQWIMRGPNRTGVPDYWTFSAQGTSLWETSGWDGTGTRGFTKVSGPGIPVVSISFVS